jgi:antitoxin component YwqK of YwqJK toxin-antitoxin module
LVFGIWQFFPWAVIADLIRNLLSMGAAYSHKPEAIDDAKIRKKNEFERFCMKIVVVWNEIYNFVQNLKCKTMRKILIIIVMALFAMPVFAQTAETVDVSKAPNGVFTAAVADYTIEGTVQNGQKVGTWFEYFNNGSYLPKKIVNYANGKKHGAFVEIDKTGSIAKKAEYKNDKLDGQYCEWYRGGRLSKMNTYKDGVLEGKQILCYEKGGNLEVSEYKNGARDGLTTWYYENGNKKMTIEYKQGQFEGKQETFYSNGSIKSEANYKNGKMQGKKKTYAEKPQAKKDAKNVDGKKK